MLSRKVLGLRSPYITAFFTTHSYEHRHLFARSLVYHILRVTIPQCTGVLCGGNSKRARQTKRKKDRKRSIRDEYTRVEQGASFFIVTEMLPEGGVADVCS